MLGLILTLFSAVTVAHPFHTSVAEAQWNEAGDRLQVSLRLSPRDLDYALSATSGRRVVLEKMPEEEAKPLLTAYLRDRIFLTANEQAATKAEPEQIKARQQRFHYVGLEQDVRYTWVYFELELPSLPGGIWLTNRVMFEADKTQINTFQMVKEKPAISLQTTREQATKQLTIARPVK